jgi:hypothetical protein
MSIYEATPHRAQIEQPCRPELREAWVKMALQYLRVHILKQEWPIQFVAEDISHLLKFDGYPPPLDKRWMGAVFSRAKREGIIKNYEVKGARVFSEVESRHKMPVWTSA